MSKFYTTEEIHQLLSKAKHHHELLYTTFKDSYLFNQFVRFLKKKENLTVNNEELVGNFISAMFYYAFIATRVAYFVDISKKDQRETVDLRGIGSSYVLTPPKPCEQAEFLQDLTELLANTRASDRTSFLDQRWSAPFNAIFRVTEE